VSEGLVQRHLRMCRPALLSEAGLVDGLIVNLGFDDSRVILRVADEFFGTLLIGRWVGRFADGERADGQTESAANKRRAVDMFLLR